MKWNYLSERGFGIKNKTKPKKKQIKPKQKKQSPPSFLKENIDYIVIFYMDQIFLSLNFNH